MTTLDLFSKEIVRLVRGMSDEAILALVRDRLGVDGGVVPTSTRATRTGASTKTTTNKTASRKSAGKASRSKGKRTVLGAAAREQLMSNVEKTILQSKGLSVSEVASRTKQPKSRVAAAIRELKSAGRIQQGGEKRFARYARDKKTALAASNAARGR